MGRLGKLSRDLKQGKKLKKPQNKKPEKRIKGPFVKPKKIGPPFIPFDTDDKVLLIGEGDYSFALSIVENQLIDPFKLVATSFDTFEEVKQKYPEVAEANLEALKEYGVNLIDGVDATKLIKTLKLTENPKKQPKNAKLFENYRLNLILFNFPHVGKGIKDQDRNIQQNQQLLVDYFKNCKQVFDLLAKCRRDQFKDKFHDTTLDKIGVVLFDGEPYDSWKVKALAKQTINFKVQRSGQFDWGLFQGYHHRKTAGMNETTKVANTRMAKLFVFEDFRVKPPKKPTSDDDFD